MEWHARHTAARGVVESVFGLVSSTAVVSCDTPSSNVPGRRSVDIFLDHVSDSVHTDFNAEIALSLSPQRSGQWRKMTWTVSTFCGFLGWFVVLQSFYLSPFAHATDSLNKSTCLITCAEGEDLHCAVEADDGYIYDAVALRRWLRQCQTEHRTPCVIPSKPIRVVRAVRTHHWSYLSSVLWRYLKSPTCHTVGTQTEPPTPLQLSQLEPPPKPPIETPPNLKPALRIRPSKVRLPSAHTAFVPLSRKCAPK